MSIGLNYYSTIKLNTAGILWILKLPGWSFETVIVFIISFSWLIFAAMEMFVFDEQKAFRFSSSWEFLKGVSIKIWVWLCFLLSPSSSLILFFSAFLSLGKYPTKLKDWPLKPLPMRANKIEEGPIKGITWILFLFI